jgi:hypothetical protein
MGGFVPKKWSFCDIHIQFLKVLFSPLDSAQKTTQFSILKFCSISSGYQDIQKSKHSMLYFGAPMLINYGG